MTDINILQERAKKIKLFATDLDGTLLDQRHILRDDTRSALFSLYKKGIILVAATGRARSSIPETVKSLEGLKYLITVNGAKLFLNKTGELIYEKYLSAAALDSVLHLLSDPEVMMEIFWDDIPHVELNKYNKAKDYGIPRWFSNYFFDSRAPLENFLSAVRENEHKIENINFVFGSDAVKERVYKDLYKNRDLFALTSAFSFNYEIGAAGVNKGAAVDFIAKCEGILPEETICFGDNDNDVTMIEYAGIGVATANAVPGVLAAADHVTEDNENEGVAKALKLLELI
jgi:Cof subfamily protein (haloacid dehalogenase superfamily)